MGVNGYDRLLTVHDEVLTEAPDYFHEHLSTPLATSLAWTLDLPLSSGEFGAYHHKIIDLYMRMIGVYCCLYTHKTYGGQVV